MQSKHYSLVHGVGSWDKHKLLDSNVFLPVITHQLSWTVSDIFPLLSR